VFPIFTFGLRLSDATARRSIVHCMQQSSNPRKRPQLRFSENTSFLLTHLIPAFGVNELKCLDPSLLRPSNVTDTRSISPHGIKAPAVRAMVISPQFHCLIAGAMTERRSTIRYTQTRKGNKGNRTSTAKSHVNTPCRAPFVGSRSVDGFANYRSFRPFSWGQKEKKNNIYAYDRKPAKR